MRVIVTGATGFLGQNIVNIIKEKYDCFSLGFNNASKKDVYKVDLTNKKEVFSILNKINPDVIIHTVALTDVDKRQNDPFNAYQLNVQTTKNIVDWVQYKDNDIQLIYISTDQVYNNECASSEIDDVSPINVYGMTKLWGEEKALLLKKSTVLRVNFVGFGENGLIGWLIRMNNKKSKVKLFNDVTFNPIYIPNLVNIIISIVEEKKYGIFNVGSAGGCMTKAEYATKIIDRFSLCGIRASVGRMANTSFITAPRPLNMCLDVNKIENSLNIKLPSLEESINLICIDYLKNI